MASSPVLRRGVGLAIAAAGLLALLLGGMRAAELRSRLQPNRLLVAPRALVMTPDGSVLVGSPPLSKVHVFAADGRPLRSWRLATEGVAFRLALAAPDRLQVAPAGSEALLEYSLQGEALGQREDPEAWQRIGGANELRLATGTGAVYTIEGGQLSRSEAGQRRLLANGFASMTELVLRIGTSVALLLGGALGLLAGFLLTARRRPTA